MPIGNYIGDSWSSTTARRKRYWCLPETISGIPEAARLLVGKGIDTYRKLYRGFKKIYIGDWDVFSTFYRIILRSPCIRFRMFTFLSAYYQAEVLSENLQTIRRIYLFPDKATGSEWLFQTTDPHTFTRMNERFWLMFILLCFGGWYGG